MSQRNLQDGADLHSTNGCNQARERSDHDVPGPPIRRRDVFALAGLCLVPFYPLAVAGSSFETRADAGTQAGGRDAVAEFVASVPGQTQALLASLLTPDQLRKTYLTIGNPAAYGSIGPLPKHKPDLANQPPRLVRLPLDNSRGDGTLSRPWRGAIADYLDAFRVPKEPKGFIAPEWGAIDPETVERYMATLAYEPVAIALPPGHYLEDAISLPPGVWLVGERDAHLHVMGPGDRREPSGPFLRMRTGCGLIGLDIDGSNIREFVPDPPYRVNGVVLQHHCVIHGCHIHHWPGSGIRSDGKRSRGSNRCRITGNIIEYVGYSGARLGSEARFEHNQVRYCGLLRPSGGGGDDAVIAEFSSDSVIANNLCIGRRMPHGRHVISGQNPRRTRVLGNIAIAEGPMRNNIGFSDGAHFNEFIGNVMLGLGSGGRIQAGISNSGYGATIKYNASIGNTRAFRNKSGCVQRSGEFRKSLISNNYGEYQRSGIHRSSCYIESDNELKRSSRPLPLDVVYESFGFFTWA